MKRQRRKFHQPGPFFILPQQPAPDDTRPRNAFGYLIGFGEAAAEYYRRRDEEQANGDR
jgi:hypothetical protein